MKSAQKIPVTDFFSKNMISIRENFIRLEEITIQKNQRICGLITAIFEGIGFGGIISAAFWYATAPMAPDGFKGPIATLTIAITTITSLLLAIPIAYKVYKRFNKNLKSSLIELSLAKNQLEDNINELYFELIKLRNLIRNDNDYIMELKNTINSELIEVMGREICKIYSLIKNKRFYITWNNNYSLKIILNDETYNIKSLTFNELFNDQDLIQSKAFKNAIINYTSCYISNSIVHSPVKYIPASKNITISIIAAITCAEVLLSIGWTISSIMIGVKMLEPISIQAWATFAIICIAISPLFGLGIYLNNGKKRKYDIVKSEINYWRKIISEAILKINFLSTKKIMEQRTTYPPKSNFLKLKLNGFERKSIGD